MRNPMENLLGGSGAINKYTMQKMSSMMGKDEKRDGRVFIDLNQICPRYENYYITREDELVSIVEDIRVNGYIQPIEIIKIHDYLYEAKKLMKSNDKKWKKFLEPAVEYYSAMADKGFTYFVTVGNTRYKAGCSLFSGHTVFTKADLDEFYKQSEEYYKEKNRVKSANAERRIRGERELGFEYRKWDSIPVEIIDTDDEEFMRNTIEKEYEFFINSNNKQRSSTIFNQTFIFIQKLDYENRYQALKEEIAGRIIDNTDSRNIKEKMKKLRDDHKEYEGYMISDANLNEMREILKEYVGEYATGFDKEVTAELVRIANSKGEKDFNIDTMRIARKLYDDTPERLKEMVFNGKLTIRDFKMQIIPLLNELNQGTAASEKKLDDVIKQIESGTLNLKKKEKVKKEKKVFTTTEVLKYLYTIKNNPSEETINEVISILENKKKK